jgi:hypothetical protein
VREVLPPRSHYTNPSIALLAHSSLSLPLFFLAWLPCLELCQRVRGNYTCRTPSRWQISSQNPSSSVALLDQSPNDVYRSYVCNSLEVPPCGTMSLRRCCRTGIVASWHCDVKIFTTLSSATSSSSSTPVRERNPRVRPTRVCLCISS